MITRPVSNGHLQFRKGTIAMSDSIFSNAQWIGAGNRVLNAHTMSVFQFSYSVQILPGSTKAGFLFGGNDARLMDRNKNIQDAESGPDGNYVELRLDISGLPSGKPARILALRTGYTKDEADHEIQCVEVPEELLSEANMNAPHRILVKAVYGEIDVFVDGSQLTKSTSRFGGMGWNLNPVGAGGNFICFPLLSDIGVKMLPGEEAVFSDLEIRNFRKPESLLYRDFAGGVSFSGGSEGFLTLKDPSYGGMTMLRSRFNVEKPLKKALVRATARGIYELYFNGKKVGEDWFAPGLSQYNKTHYYQEYDVTGLLSEGENCWSAYLAEGWWSGAISYTGENWNFFGDRLSLIGTLCLQYEDGSVEVLTTSDKTWEASQDGPVIYGSLFQGEVLDLRKGFESGWEPAVSIPLSEENAFLGEMRQGPFAPPEVISYDSVQFLPQKDRGVHLVERIAAKALTEPRPGVYVYDLGQNIAGVPEIEICGKDGQRLTLRFAEILYPDMPEYAERAGMLMLENIRGALAQDTVVLREGIQTVCPHFTQHGFRYIEITGISDPLPLSSVRGLALSSADVSSEFCCSDPLINRLYQNIVWSLRDNFISVPTDCPQRNERMGWSGDLSVFAPTAISMADCDEFLRRQLQALRDCQSPQGRFSDIAPIGGGFGGILWGSVGITVPWELYKETRDLSILSGHFDAMCRYLRFLRTKLDDRGIMAEGPLGDWLGPENRNNEPAFLWQCYYVYDLDIVIRCADLLGEQAVKEEFLPEYESAQKTLHDYYIDPVSGQTVFTSEDTALGKVGMFGFPPPPAKEKLPEKSPTGKYLMDTQTSYAVALALGVLYPKFRPLAAEHLRDALARENMDDLHIVRPPYSLMTGFIGTAWILHALSENGLEREAFRLLQSREYPSWLYPVLQGATTIWERLDSFTLDRGFGGNNSMNSFNHYSFGAVGSWMLRHVLGFTGEFSEEGAVLQPTPDPDGRLRFAEGSMVIRKKRYALRWEITDQGTVYTVTVPEGESAVLWIPESFDTPVGTPVPRKKVLLHEGLNRI